MQGEESKETIQRNIRVVKSVGFWVERGVQICPGKDGDFLSLGSSKILEKKNKKMYWYMLSYKY